MLERILRQALAVAVSVSLISSQSMGGWDVGVMRAAKRAAGNQPDPAESHAQQNTPPTISKIADRIIAKNGVATATFLVNDPETPGVALVVSASSDNSDLLPKDHLVVTTDGGARTLTATPMADKEGTATITVTVTDAGGVKATTNFKLTVKAELPYIPGEMLVTYRKGASASAPSSLSSSPGAGKSQPSAQTAHLTQSIFQPLLQKRKSQGPSALRVGAPRLNEPSRVPPGGEDLSAKSLDSLQRTYVMKFDPGQDIQNIKEILKRDPTVESVQENKTYTINSVNDPLMVGSHLWGLTKIYAQEAWDNSPKGEDVVVAVLDTGIDSTHPDLAANVWTNSNEIPNNGIDDDGNGYVDDVHGWNFAENNNKPVDGHYHGTHVSGTIAALGNNGRGIVGVAYKAKIMPLKGLDDTGTGSDISMINGLVYAADNGAAVINNSWGAPGS
ncbi:MAG: S8 family serine peptidase [Elusimicrobia bacterium]|nr:S8 family serine peptidase [Elusimicrobiota bacterium]